MGVSTASFFMRCYTEEAVRRIAKLGVKHCEVFLCSFQEYEKAYTDELSRIIKGEGLECTAVHCLTTQIEPQLFSGHERQRTFATDAYCRLLDAAHDFGAGIYVMHGMINQHKNIGLPNFERVARYLRPLTELAQERGVRLTLENVHWCMYHFAGYAKGLEPYIVDTNLGYTLDIKQAMQASDDPFAYVGEMGNRLANIHLCGVSGLGRRTHTHLPEKGDFDNERLAARLKDLQYDGPVTLEVYPGDFENDAQLGQSVRYMERIF